MQQDSFIKSFYDIYDCIHTFLQEEANIAKVRFTILLKQFNTMNISISCYLCVCEVLCMDISYAQRHCGEVTYTLWLILLIPIYTHTFLSARTVWSVQFLYFLCMAKRKSLVEKNQHVYIFQQVGFSMSFVIFLFIKLSVYITRCVAARMCYAFLQASIYNHVMILLP